MANGGEVVRFRNVGMRYGIGPEVLHDVSFGLKAGSFHFLTGPSGAGKSSLLKLMYVALHPSRGLINLFGNDVATVERRDLPAIRRRIGVVFQDFRLIEHLSAVENVALPLRVAGAGGGHTREHVTDLLGWVGLEEQLNSRPSTLSGGQQQRVAIARAVIARPELLLADEPTGSLDADTGRQIIELMFRLAAQHDTTLLLITHEAALAERCSRRIQIEDGTILADPAEAGA